MACGDKYKNLAVTPSGYTLDDPGPTLLPGSSIGLPLYAEWYELARKLSAAAHDRYVELGEIEGQKNTAYPAWNALVDLNNQVAEGYDALSAPALVLFSYGAARDEALAVIKNALCLMESADNGIASYEPAKPPPAKVPWYVWTGGGLVVVGALSTTIYVLVKHHRRNRDEREYLSQQAA